VSDQTPLRDPLADAFEGFRGDSLPLVTAPGPEAVRGVVRRRQRNRAIGVAAFAMVALIGAGVAFATAGGPNDRLQPADRPTPSSSASPSATPSGSASPSPSTSPSTSPASLRTVSWRNATISLPALTSCPGGTITFTNGAAKIGDHQYSLLLTDPKPAYGDVNRDGREDAVFPVYCGSGGTGQVQLIAVSAAGTALRAFGTVTLEADRLSFASYTVADGAIVATVREAPDGGAAPRTQTRRYRWNGGAFEQIGGPSAFPAAGPDATSFGWSTATLAVPFRGAAAAIQPNDRSCPRLTVTFTRVSETEGAVQSGGCEYWITKLATGDLDRDGTPDALVKITATAIGGSSFGTGTSWYFVYTVRAGKPALVGFVTAAALPAEADTAKLEVQATGASAGSGVRVTQIFRAAGKPDQTLARTFQWNGSRFAPSQAPPDPRADIAP
jgi:hypothetical protein